MTRVLLSSPLVAAIADEQEFGLEPDVAKKLVRVLRLTQGETFIGFDGLGREWECALTSVESVGKRPAAKAIAIEELAVAPQSTLRLSVAQAIPKGDKMEFVLQKGTELGVAEFWPFEASRSVTRVLFEEDDSARATARAQRWRRIVEAAVGQCGRADLPIVHAIADFSTVVSQGTNSGRTFMLDERPEAKSLREALREQPLEKRTDGDETPPQPVMLLVGPEGGWTSEERDFADRYGAEPVSLGKRILRTETAALAAATILAWEAGEM